MIVPEGYSIAIPSYGRPEEFEELLTSIINSTQLPDEVIICEDYSKQRSILKVIGDKWAPVFEAKGCKFNYIENEINLGYDANIRKLIQLSSFKWVILIGNDDLLLPEGIGIINEFCLRNPNVAMISRPFIRFNTDINKPLGISRFFDHEVIINNEMPANLLFRVAGFVGGLIVNKNWAEPLHTNKYDGTLYYQIYLASHAYCTNGIGYLAKPTVGGRAGNPPLFGEAGAKNHSVGAYSASARTSMWKGVLNIGKDVGAVYGIDLYSPLKRELTVRQSFHIFEMNATAGKHNLKELRRELSKLGLFDHIVPKTLYYINFIFGNRSSIVYRFVRKYMQKK
ncbi:glycosyltransferase family A protein [Mucilaginibacter galii]|uniref:O-antigen-related glycosyl transferase n=1 Tax=Mucilaginibacter galii TaxID=2005073 RepID=A0A917JAC6_9SPHI|nr:glycosyltransferase family A protein [Mucilaginibacter galii]GGI51459.1 O-antigen-related glycosyl transferase [Mucilaginibacter galii]